MIRNTKTTTFLKKKLVAFGRLKKNREESTVCRPRYGGSWEECSNGNDRMVNVTVEPEKLIGRLPEGNQRGSINSLSLPRNSIGIELEEGGYASPHNRL